VKTLKLTALILAASASLALASPFQTVDSAKGKVIAGENGMTLYTFKKDTDGKPACYDACATLWPPYIAAKDAKAETGYTMVARKDGSMQWAKDGMPLYFWAKDKKMGDATGDGVKGVWDAARP
jgi:predicted lipoprotein with Yx(FWY)xxD motif